MAKKKTEEYNSWCEELKDFQESDLDQRDQAREADRFLLEKDGQWEDTIRQKLDSAGRPRYTFDKVTPVIESMMTDVEDMDFGCDVKPEGGEANKPTALTYDGMIRGIQNQSKAEHLFRKSCRRLMRRGFDAWVVKARYRDDRSFEQDLFIDEIPNAINRVWVSNTCKKESSEDATVAYVLSSMAPKDYEKEWPKGSKVSVDDGFSNYDFQNYDPETITIAERYYRKEVEIEVGQLNTGEVVELDDKWNKVKDDKAAIGVNVVKTKKAKVYKWYHCVFDGGGILEESRETVFRSCPVVTVYGNHELLGHGSKITYSGIVLKEMDAQRVHNYAKSREIEEGALSPRSKWWMTREQGKGHSKQLSKLNVSSDPVQFYNVDPKSPQVPFYGAMAPINPGLSNLGNQMNLDIKEQANVNDGMQGNFGASDSEASVRMKINRGTGATKKWVNSLLNGIQRVCDILIETIPAVYDTPRTFALVAADGTEDIVMLNEETYDRQSGEMVRLNMLNEGQYKVTASAGAAFTNRLEAGLAAMLEYAAIDPTIVQQGGDLMLKSIDAPLVDQMAERKRWVLIQQGMIPDDQLTEEEKEKIAMANQQPKEPDAMTIAAMAEDKKANADLMQAQNDQVELQLKAGELELKARAQQIEIAKLEQSGVKVNIEEAKAVASIRNTNADTMNKMANTEKTQSDTMSNRLDTISKLSPTVQ